MGEEPERLRARAEKLQPPKSNYIGNMEYAVAGTNVYVKEAQVLIPALLAEVERLARDDWEKVAKSARNRTWQAEAECERLAGRVAALTAALTAVYRETLRGKDVRANRTGIIGNVNMLVQDALNADALADVGGSE